MRSCREFYTPAHIYRCITSTNRTVLLCQLIWTYCLYMLLRHLWVGYHSADCIFISFGIKPPILVTLKIEYLLRGSWGGGVGVGGVYCHANYTAIYEETPLNRVSDFLSFMCFLISKGNHLDFYVIGDYPRQAMEKWHLETKKVVTELYRNDLSDLFRLVKSLRE